MYMEFSKGLDAVQSPDSFCSEEVQISSPGWGSVQDYGIDAGLTSCFMGPKSILL